MKYLFSVVAMLLAVSASAAPGLFSSEGLNGWVEQTFRNKAQTAYRLVQDGGVQVLEADCAKAASGWLWKESIDLKRTPLLRWRWKVERLPEGAPEQTKPGDDFGARVYVVRKTGLTPLSLRSVVYVWAHEAPAGSDWPNPYTAKAHHVALRSGRAGLGEWREEQRDLAADFRRYFDIETDTVDSVALMTDCDDTGGAARARYGDIRLEPASKDSKPSNAAAGSKSTSLAPET